MSDYDILNSVNTVDINTGVENRNYKFVNRTRTPAFVYAYQKYCELNVYKPGLQCNLLIDHDSDEIKSDFTSFVRPWNKLYKDPEYKILCSDNKYYNPGYYVPGYSPSFQKQLFEWDGSGENTASWMYSGWRKVIINRTESQLEFVRYKEDQFIDRKIFTKNYFPDGVVPSKVLVEMNGGGGAGGASLWAVGGWGGNGGGGGGYVCFVVDLSYCSSWIVNLPRRAGGGGAGSPNGGNGLAVSMSPNVPDLLDYKVEATGGKGGSGGGGQSRAAGGSYSITQPEDTQIYWELAHVNGGKGGSVPAGHGNGDSVYQVTSISTLNRWLTIEGINKKTRGSNSGGTSTGSGQGTASGGGACALNKGANGVATQDGTFAKPGAGGAGGSYFAVAIRSGGAGGWGYFACYY